jgi:hypothetical protein
MLLEPVLVGLDGQRSHEPQATFTIGEDAHDMSAPPDLLVEALQTTSKCELAGIYFKNGSAVLDAGPAGPVSRARAPSPRRSIMASVQTPP